MDDEKEDEKFNNNNLNKELDEKINNLISYYKSNLNEKYIEKRKIILKSSENGDFSYINSLFNCLGNILDLLLYLQRNKNKINDSEKYPFTFSCFRIIEHLINKNSKKDPNDDVSSFIKIIEHFYPFFKTNKNPIDLFNILMNLMHNELNIIQKNNINPFYEENIDKRDLNKMIHYKIIKFNQDNDTIISKCFNLFCKKEIKCFKCNSIFYELQNFISFDLDPINTYKKYKRSNLSIYDCLAFYLSPVSGKAICSICNHLAELSIQKKIYSPSSNLVLVINRNNPNEEKEILYSKIKYEEILDISNYIDKKMVYFKAEYILIGVVAFLFEKKKFVSFCKDLFHNEWICFDEESIDECNFNYMLNNSSPYIFFYKMLD